jgi:hypothetical protein
MSSGHYRVLSMFIEANISICCSVCSSIGGGYRRVKGSESCHHDTNHDMISIYVHSHASLPPFKHIRFRERERCTYILELLSRLEELCT